LLSLVVWIKCLVRLPPVPPSLPPSSTKETAQYIPKQTIVIKDENDAALELQWTSMKPRVGKGGREEGRVGGRQGGREGGKEGGSLNEEMASGWP